MKTMTVKEWQDETGATGEPDDVMGVSMALDAIITVSDDGESYCVGEYDGNQTWMRFDGRVSESQVAEREAFAWARANQGFSAPYEEWLKMDTEERQQYERGAAGLPTDAE